MPTSASRAMSRPTSPPCSRPACRWPTTATCRRPATAPSASLRQACEAVVAGLPAAKRPPALMMALHIWSLSHGIASLFARGDAARRTLPMTPEELLEAATLVYLQGLGLSEKRLTRLSSRNARRHPGLPEAGVSGTHPQAPRSLGRPPALIILDRRGRMR